MSTISPVLDGVVPSVSGTVDDLPSKALECRVSLEEISHPDPIDLDVSEFLAGMRRWFDNNRCGGPAPEVSP